MKRIVKSFFATSLIFSLPAAMGAEAPKKAPPEAAQSATPGAGAAPQPAETVPFPLTILLSCTSPTPDPQHNMLETIMQLMNSGELERMADKSPTEILRLLLYLCDLITNEKSEIPQVLRVIPKDAASGQTVGYNINVTEDQLFQFMQKAPYIARLVQCLCAKVEDPTLREQGETILKNPKTQNLIVSGTDDPDLHSKIFCYFSPFIYELYR